MLSCTVCACMYVWVWVYACYDNLPFFVCCPVAELSGCSVVGVAILLVGDCCRDGSLSLTGDGWLLF